jgi:hypothetical protein
MAPSTYAAGNEEAGSAGKAAGNTSNSDGSISAPGTDPGNETRAAMVTASWNEAYLTDDANLLQMLLWLEIRNRMPIELVMLLVGLIRLLLQLLFGMMGILLIIR